MLHEGTLASSRMNACLTTIWGNIKSKNEALVAAASKSMKSSLLEVEMDEVYAKFPKDEQGKAKALLNVLNQVLILIHQVKLLQEEIKSVHEQKANVEESQKGHEDRHDLL